MFFHRFRFVTLGLGLLGFALQGPVASATTLVELSLPSMTHAAEIILQGEVRTTHIQNIHGQIYTVLEVHPEEYLKGESRQPILVALPGGLVNGNRRPAIQIQVPGVPEAQTGDRALLFLEPLGGTRFFQVVGFSQGFFRIHGEADGEDALRDQRQSRIVTTEGKTRAGTFHRLPLNALKEEIYAVVEQQRKVSP